MPKKNKQYQIIDYKASVKFSLQNFLNDKEVLVLWVLEYGY